MRYTLRGAFVGTGLGLLFAACSDDAPSASRSEGVDSGSAAEAGGGVNLGEPDSDGEEQTGSQGTGMPDEPEPLAMAPAPAGGESSTTAEPDPEPVDEADAPEPTTMPDVEEPEPTEQTTEPEAMVPEPMGAVEEPDPYPVEVICAPGTVGPVCEPCVAGEYCAGGPADDAEAEGCLVWEEGTNINDVEVTFDEDLDPATPCVEVTDCEPGEFVLAHSTATEDRECSPCEEGRSSSGQNALTCANGGSPGVTCDATEYASAGVCLALTECSAGSYVSEEATPASNRTCRVCEPGSYSSLSNVAECAVWTVCGESEFESASGSSTSDRECTELRECVPGEFVSAPASSTTDVTCSPCAEGSYSSTSNRDECTPWSVCGGGETESVAGTSTGDRVCSTCASGQYRSAGECIALSECGDTEYESAPPTATSDRVCSDLAVCPAGYYVQVEQTRVSDRRCSPCGGGTYSTTDNAPECTPWATCEPGSRTDFGGSSNSSRTCESCETGTFTDIANQLSCELWTTCVAGQKVNFGGSYSADRTCLTCEDETFTIGTNQESCADWTVCEEGSRINVDGSPSLDRTCLDCEEGTFSSDINQESCADWTVCEPGTKVVFGGSDTEDRTCTECEANANTSSPNQPSCSCDDGWIREGEVCVDEVNCGYDDDCEEGEACVEGAPGTGEFSCNACPGSTDIDEDGICDNVDICPSGDNAEDADADGTPDACDACPNNATLSTYNWVSWSSVTTGLATGVAGGVSATFTSTVDIGSTPNPYLPDTFPAVYEVPTMGTTIRNDYISSNTLTFEREVADPLLIFASVGNPSNSVGVQFSTDIVIVWEQDVTSFTNNSFVGAEGFVIVRLPGIHTTVSFDYLAEETYANFGFGFGGSEGDTDEDGVPDACDACPSVFGTDSDGCPIP